MTDTNTPHPVISPPSIPTTSTSRASPPEEPISPVSRTTTFPHKSSAGVPSTTRPFIETATPAINDMPIELDGVATSPDELERRGTGGNKAISPGLGEEEDIEEEFLGEPGERGVGRSRREKRAEILANRSKDPGVIVNVPQEPTAEEVEAAKSAEGTVTPGLPSHEAAKEVGR